MHFLFVSSINAYKFCIINFLLTSLARYVQRNIGPQSFCTNLALRARSVQKKTSRSVNKKLIMYAINSRLIKWHEIACYIPLILVKKDIFTPFEDWFGSVDRIDMPHTILNFQI